MWVISDNKGQGLALVIVLTALIFAVGAASVALATSSRRNAGLEVCQKKAYYIAEAGLEKAVFGARCGESWLEQLDPGGKAVNLVPDYIFPEYADGRIEYVNVKKDDSVGDQDLLSVECSGSCRKANCTLQARVEVNRSLELWTVNILSWGEGGGLQ